MRYWLPDHDSWIFRISAAGFGFRKVSEFFTVFPVVLTESINTCSGNFLMLPGKRRKAVLLKTSTFTCAWIAFWSKSQTFRQRNWSCQKDISLTLQHKRHLRAMQSDFRLNAFFTLNYRNFFVFQSFCNEPMSIVLVLVVSRIVFRLHISPQMSTPNMCAV